MLNQRVGPVQASRKRPCRKQILRCRRAPGERNPSTRSPRAAIFRTSATTHYPVGRSDGQGTCIVAGDASGRVMFAGVRSRLAPTGRDEVRCCRVCDLAPPATGPPLDRVGTSASEFAASIARYSERESNPVEFALPNSLRCRVPRIGLARDSSRALGERERHAPISTRSTAPDVPSLVPS